MLAGMEEVLSLAKKITGTGVEADRLAAARLGKIRNRHVQQGPALVRATLRPVGEALWRVVNGLRRR